MTNPAGATSSHAIALEVREVRYAYGPTRAVDGVSFQIRPGEIFGLLGPNGAGKTTTISMISGLLPPESGQVLLFGREAADSTGQARRRLGVVPQDIALYEELSARENLRFFARLFGLAGKDLESAVDRALDLVGLTDRAKERAGKFSGGLKRRLNLGIGLVHGPDLLLLDEPTVGIDPQARHRILDVVRAQAKEGRAVLYTSHYLEEAEQICDRLAIMDHGRMLAAGTVEELRRLAGEGPVVTIRGEVEPARLQALADRASGITLTGAVDGTASFGASDPAAMATFVRELFASGERIEDLRVQEPNLETLFLKLTGRELRD